jgi:Mn-dependent DtxR family transcriptional regulator
MTFVRSEAFTTLQAALNLGLFEVVDAKYPAAEISTMLSISPYATVVMLEHLDSLGLVKYYQNLDTYSNSDISTSHLMSSNKTKQWREYLAKHYSIPVTANSYLEAVKSHNFSYPDPPYIKGDSGSETLTRIHTDRLTLPIAFAAHHLGIFPYIHAQRQATPMRIAKHFNITDGHAHEMLASLHSTGILSLSHNSYSLTPAGEELALPERAGAPNPYFWGGTIEVIGSAMITPESLVLKARSAPAAGAGPGAGSPMMARVETGAADARRFAAHMRAQMQRAGERIAALPLWRGTERVLDVAGGAGHYLAALAARHPALRGAVLETPHTDAAARDALAAAGLSGRLGVVAGSMWDPAVWARVQRQYDTVLLSYVVHDWRPRDAVRLLASAAAAAAAVPGGRVLVHDQFLREQGGSPPDKAGFGRLVYYWTDEGAQYRLSEVVAMAHEAGLVLDAVHPADGALSDLLVLLPARARAAREL